MKKPTKRQRELADEAWLRAQQIDLTGQLEPAGETPEGKPVEGIPETCPGCGRAMTVQSGWTILSEAGTSWQHGHLVCGSCGREVLVTTEAAARLREALHQEFLRRAERLSPLSKAKRGPRVRGAG